MAPLSAGFDPLELRRSIRVRSGKIHSSCQDHHQGIERSRVFRQFLPGIECEERQVAARGAGEHAAGDAASGRRDEGLNRKRLRRR